ncbi:MAG: hypothetical protein K2X86_16715, partial [Cytophagaceae bacterium]|nr:hypothetical protein [Cytophagaceae bacterium]
IRKTILFFGIFIITVFAIDRMLGFVLDKMYLKSLKGMAGGDINYYLAYNKVDMLAMGSSRSRNHLVPDSMDVSCYNLSHNGMGIAYQAALLDVLDKKGRLPSKYLLLQLEPYSIFLKDSFITREIQYLKYYYHSNQYVKSELDRVDKYEFVKQGFSCYKFNGILPSIIKNNIILINSHYVNTFKGFQGNDPAPDDSLNTVNGFINVEKDTDENIKRVEDYHIENIGWRYFNHVREICRKNNITLICYTSPFYGGSWHKNMDYEANKKLADEGIIYFNFSSSVIPALSSAYLWKDVTHLNTKGANIFSSILNDSLKAKGLY